MIKVFIVDDDKWVRMGLMAALPWSQYKMKVVGESSNGEKALSFLENNEVDLMLIDLSMPNMSGIQLMEIVRKKYPNIYFVVLTFHQEIEYVQKAMRLGAIDYITKAQFERENFENILDRIQKRMQEEKCKAILFRYQEEEIGPYTSDTAFVFIALDEDSDVRLIESATNTFPVEKEEIDEGLWIVILIDQSITHAFGDTMKRLIEDSNSWALLYVSGIKEVNKNVVRKVIRQYRKIGLFYDLKKENRFLSKGFEDLMNYKKEVDKDEMDSIKKILFSFAWLGDNELLMTILRKLKLLFLSPTKLIYVMQQVLIQWNITYSYVTSTEFKIPEKIIKWSDLEDWFILVKNTTRDQVSNNPYSNEITDSIMHAVRIIQEELHTPLRCADIAKRVNLSRSYFDQCFRNIVGQSFNSYLRHIRIEKAKNYLIKTDKPVQIISEMVGYLDGKYFSRLFYEQTGTLPSRYRTRKHSR